MTAGHTVLQAYTFSGARFPPNFDPQDVQATLWGSLDFSMSDADHATIGWQPGLPGYSAGTMDMLRLTQPADINQDSHDNGLRACMGGAWFNPQQSGHGLFAEVLDTGDTRLLVAAWYAYRDGKPYWLTGSGPIDGNRAEMTLGASTGGEFPPDYDPDASQPAIWGMLDWRFDGPNTSHINWHSELPGFEDGELDLVRLTTLAEAPCL